LGSDSATSPPRNITPRGLVGDLWPGDKRSRNTGEAAQTIAEECERLFCDTLFTMFLGERHGGPRRSLAMGAHYQSGRPESIKHGRKVLEWIEVWEYANDTIYRGFISEDSRGKVMFVFFENNDLEWDLKPGFVPLHLPLFPILQGRNGKRMAPLGLLWPLHINLKCPSLMALLELADNEAFNCTRIVACVPRSPESSATVLTRNLGWCGFFLTTLENFASYTDSRALVSKEWLFLVSEI
jgi:hypothetical protein